MEHIYRLQGRFFTLTLLFEPKNWPKFSIFEIFWVCWIVDILIFPYEPRRIPNFMS